MGKGIDFVSDAGAESGDKSLQTLWDSAKSKK
jgi:hypothetical protein